VLKTSEFRRWLARQGCQFVEGTGHTIVTLEGESTTLPRHGSKEIAPGTIKAILKKLGLKVEK
jgi:predicted RNA binding protein YcfA (HicA-like mRNA interferase family)